MTHSKKMLFDAFRFIRVPASFIHDFPWTSLHFHSLSDCELRAVCATLAVELAASLGPAMGLAQDSFSDDSARTRVLLVSPHANNRATSAAVKSGHGNPNFRYLSIVGSRCYRRQIPQAPLERACRDLQHASYSKHPTSKSFSKGIEVSERLKHVFQMISNHAFSERKNNFFK